ncbi:MAG: hypothetical protein SPI08_04385 [Campylobacter sp.]|uniref:hypothetical protein n=1 Tax=Campylobacter lanienae TaxID=75658 RepID=UPI000BB41ADE|nr:hypothetical protein [Campylobacter lanienae]MDY6123755.1 hypothetical protein [Campylobacter sp.]
METIGTILLWIVLAPVILFAIALVINGAGGGIGSIFAIIFGNESDKGFGCLGVIIGALMFGVGIALLKFIF